MLKALQRQPKTKEEKKAIIDLWYSKGWDGSEEVKPLVQDFCNTRIYGFLNRRVYDHASKYVLFLDSCRFAYDEAVFKTIVNDVIKALENEDDQSYFTRLSHRFVQSLNPENRKVYDAAVSCPWERILRAKLFTEEELDAARLLIPDGMDPVNYLLVFKRYLVVVLGLTDFWTGGVWKSVLKRDLFNERITWTNNKWVVYEPIVTALKSQHKSISPVQSSVAPGASSAAQRGPAIVASDNKHASPAERKGVFVASGLKDLGAVPFTAFWKKDNSLIAYHNQDILAMDYFNPGNEVIWTKQENTISMSFTDATIKTTGVTLAMLQPLLELMKVCHESGCFTGPLLVCETDGLQIRSTPPFCGSVGNEYANCGPRKAILQPSAKSDLTLLFTCLQESEADNDLWATCLQDVSNGKTVQQFLDQINESADLD